MTMRHSLETLAIMGLVQASLAPLERRPNTQKKTKNKDVTKRNKRNKAARASRKRNRQ